MPKEIADICSDKDIPKNPLITIAPCRLLEELHDEDSVSTIKAIIGGY